MARRLATGRSHRRYLAPLALVVVIVATLAVITVGLHTSHHHALAHRADRALVLHTPPRNRFYVVRAGDTLSTISVKTGVSVPTLESLNRVDPNALQTGQRLRLR